MVKVSVIRLSIVIAVLASLASATGLLWQGHGSSYPFETVRGEQVMVRGRGLYRYDSVSFAAQGVAQDAVTLIVAVPLLVAATIMAVRGRLAGHLLLSGVLGYFLYTYASYLFGVAYNQLFLLYAALVALSLFAFIGALGTVDLVSLPDRFSTRLPRRFIAGYMLLLGLSITLMWLGRIGPALADGRPPEGLELYTTLVIQGLDFGVLLPSIFLAGVLLWQGRNWGFLLAPVVLVKGSTLLLAIVAMIINEAVSGIPVSPVESVVFGAFTVANIVLTLAFLMYTRDR